LNSKSHCCNNAFTVGLIVLLVVDKISATEVFYLCNKLFCIPKILLGAVHCALQENIMYFYKLVMQVILYEAVKPILCD